MKIFTQLAIISILVEDQDEALRFYTEKLGLEKRADMTYGPGMRWLTVAPKGQKRPEIALAKPDPSCLSIKRTHEFTEGVGQGIMWVFDTEDCCKMYVTLLSRGVQFLGPPTRQLYGMEALFADPFGNVFSLLEPSQDAYAMFGNLRVGTAA